MGYHETLPSNVVCRKLHENQDFLLSKALGYTAPGKRRTVTRWVVTASLGYWPSFPTDTVSPVVLPFQGDWWHRFTYRLIES